MPPHIERWRLNVEIKTKYFDAASKIFAAVSNLCENDNRLKWLAVGILSDLEDKLLDVDNKLVTDIRTIRVKFMASQTPSEYVPELMLLGICIANQANEIPTFT
jgi:hypothetical protein